MIWYVYKFETKDLQQTRISWGESMLEAIFNIENTLRFEFKSNEFKITYIRELYYDN